MSEKYAYILIIMSTLTIVTLCYNISILFVYKSKLPFFEQYRINPQVIIHLFRNLGLGKKIMRNGIN
jgi:hypothetical protein